MAILPILVSSEPVLRQKAKRVRHVDGSVRRLIDDMRETMHHARGVGLAAPQVGASLRVVVICLPDEEDMVLINPQIVRRRGERWVNEGCLSIPGYYGEVKRAESVTVKAHDQNGREIRVKGTELLAQALEHEIDHINGTLYIDHLESEDELHKIEAEETPL